MLLVASLDPEVLGSLSVGVAVGLPVCVGSGPPGVGLPVGLPVGLGFLGLGFGPPGFGPPEELPGPIDGTFYCLISLLCEVQVCERKPILTGELKPPPPPPPPPPPGHINGTRHPGSHKEPSQAQAGSGVGATEPSDRVCPAGISVDTQVTAVVWSVRSVAVRISTVIVWF